MNTSQTFVRSFFVFLSIIFSAAYTTTALEGGFTPLNLVLGMGLGLLLGFALLSTEFLFKNINLKAFNTALLGLLFGYLMGEGILTILNAIADLTTLQAPAMNFIRTATFLFSIYLAMTLTARATDELYICLPFVRFKPTSQKKKDILLDSSILLDPRLIDLATSGLLDQHIIIPRFTLKELNDGLESSDENTKTRSRRGLEVLKKLDNIPSLEVRYIDTDFVDVKDATTKLIRLARMNDANIFTADMNRIQQSAHEGVKIINIHSLSNALKPITQTGEYINIKIQRYGKEPRQGVGYLEDGTMVVINGGAEFIGETIKAQVLSVKHTSSGRMIFCNAADDSLLSEDEIEQTVANMENSQKNYFAF